MTRFVPTRAAGLARLTAFLPAAGRLYAGRRNTDYGPDDRHNVSVLSPWIRHRLVTEEEVLGAVLGHHTAAQAEKFIQEVFWRSYFKGHLETRPEIWTRYRGNLRQQLAAVAEGGGFARAYRQAVAGRTGIDAFDAWIEELTETGYLHNHSRMWFASIWIFTLKLPWELGADFTYRHFVDGDPASNTLSWRWVAGLHTRGKTYLARPDNIREHTLGRFAPMGLAREAPALEEPPLAPAQRLPALPAAAPAGPALLLVTEEDGHCESLDRGHAEIVGVVGAAATQERSPLPVAEHAITFAAGAVEDTVARAARHLGVEGRLLPSLSAVTLRDAARAAGVQRIVTAATPVGPVADLLAEARPRLAGDGIDLVAIRRHFDTLVWPLATRGFFSLKERIPSLIAERGLDRRAAQGELFASSGA